jgi:hypothetical protein
MRKDCHLGNYIRAKPVGHALVALGRAQGADRARLGGLAAINFIADTIWVEGVNYLPRGAGVITASLNFHKKYCPLRALQPQCFFTSAERARLWIQIKDLFSDSQVHVRHLEGQSVPEKLNT